jgi:hypothetical protein
VIRVDDLLPRCCENRNLVPILLRGSTTVATTDGKLHYQCTSCGKRRRLKPDLLEEAGLAVYVENPWQ